MKKAMIMLVGVFVLCGCATFGTFANLKKGKTTQAEVRSMLGEPANRIREGASEVWEYEFTKADTKRAMGPQTAMNLTITFKENVVDDYKIELSKESQQTREALSPARRPLRPSMPLEPRRR